MAQVFIVKRVSQDPTVTAGAYSSGDAIGGLLTFKNITTAGNGDRGALVESVLIVDEAAQGADVDLVLFDRTFTATADNAAFDPTDADLLNCIGVVNITTHYAFNDNGISIERAFGLPIPSTTDGSIYGQLVSRGTPTYAATTDVSAVVTTVN
jgi:hypothetical protein